MLPRGSRYAVRDELITPTEYDSIRQLYHELEGNYHESGRYREASDFRYGKMEMLRTAEPAALRNTSVLAAYKYLSGDGERYGLRSHLASILYPRPIPGAVSDARASGRRRKRDPAQSEVSTFMKPTTTSTSQITTRFVEGIERLVAPLQAGLFVLAVNRRLGRA